MCLHIGGHNARKRVDSCTCELLAIIDRACIKENPVAGISGVQALISENSTVYLI